MSDLGKLHYFLGIFAVSHQGGWFLQQQKYTLLLKRSGMSDSSPVSTPMVSPTHLIDDDCPAYSDPVAYRSIVGALQYLTFTRPDIQFVVNQVCQFIHQPLECHFIAVKSILRYLKGIPKLCLHIYANYLSPLSVYAVFDWAGCPSTRCSTSGFRIFLGSTLLSWFSKKQTTVSHSSAEAEYRSVPHFVAELDWVTSVLRELRIPVAKSPIVLCDNISATYMAANPVKHARNKHIEIERVAKGTLKVSYIPTGDQLTYLFTKSLSTDRFKTLCFNLGIGEPPPSIVGDE